MSEEPVDPAKALLDKLEVILARPTLWTPVGYLHVVHELELDEEVAALHDQFYPPAAEPEAEAQPEGEAQPQQSF